MKKNVMVQISGLHNAETPDDAVEVLLPGNYYNRNGTHYIKYQQYDEESGRLLDNLIKIKDETLEIKKKGASSMQMFFKKNHRNVSYYDMEQGSLLMETRTQDVKIQQREQRIDVELAYDLFINEQYVSDSHIKIQIFEAGCPEIG